jgi:hypothetical protein
MFDSVDQSEAADAMAMARARTRAMGGQYPITFAANNNNDSNTISSINIDEKTIDVCASPHLSNSYYKESVENANIPQRGVSTQDTGPNNTLTPSRTLSSSNILVSDDNNNNGKIFDADHTRGANETISNAMTNSMTNDMTNAMTNNSSNSNSSSSISSIHRVNSSQALCPLQPSDAYYLEPQQQQQQQSLANTAVPFNDSFVPPQLYSDLNFTRSDTGGTNTSHMEMNNAFRSGDINANINMINHYGRQPFHSNANDGDDNDDDSGELTQIRPQPRHFSCQPNSSNSSNLFPEERLRNVNGYLSSTLVYEGRSGSSNSTSSNSSVKEMIDNAKLKESVEGVFGVNNAENCILDQSPELYFNEIGQSSYAITGFRSGEGTGDARAGESSRNNACKEGDIFTHLDEDVNSVHEAMNFDMNCNYHYTNNYVTEDSLSDIISIGSNATHSFISSGIGSSSGGDGLHHHYHSSGADHSDTGNSDHNRPWTSGGRPAAHVIDREHLEKKIYDSNYILSFLDEYPSIALSIEEFQSSNSVNEL